MTIQTRWEEPDTLLARNERTRNEELARVVQEIAQARFNFPTQEHPSYRTHVNVPEVTMAVKVGEEEIAPDIVVIDKRKTGETYVAITAAVANKEMVNEDEAKTRWARWAAIKDVAFYVYVPVGYGQKAKTICRNLKVRPDGYRTWRWAPSGFEINEISEQESALAVLMPPLVRRLLRTP